MKAVSGKTTMPILESILIETEEDHIKMTGNDMEMAIETILEGIIEEEGAILVDAKMFSEFVRKMPSEEIVIERKLTDSEKIVYDTIFLPDIETLEILDHERKYSDL